MCDMCSSPESVYRIELEGSRLNVCEKCSSFGRIIAKLKQEEEPVQMQEKKPGIRFDEAKSKKKKETETVQLIVSNYPQLIKNKRESMGLMQKELAKKIAEKESVVHKLESGIMKPGLDLARKLEKFLKLKLIEEVELESKGKLTGGKSSEGLTIGDLMKI